MLAAALRAADTLGDAGVRAAVVNVPVIKPIDAATIRAVAGAARAVVTAENHSIVGGLGSAVAEVLAEAGLGRPLRRVGLQDTFAEGARMASALFRKYGLGAQDLVDAAWEVLDRPGPAPEAAAVEAAEGEYAPV
jgi:transketolase